MKKYFFTFLIVIFATASAPAFVRADGDVMAPASAGATTIAGVNWGTVTTTDNSIIISNAHIIGVTGAGPKTFYIEWGTGLPGQYATYEHVGQTTPPTTLLTSYNFSATLSNLSPMTSYYYNIWEVVNSPGGTVQTNLFTYGFATTSMLGNNGVHYTFPNGSGNNDLTVFGQLVNAAGSAILTAPINIILQDANHVELTSAEAITGQLFTQNGAGYFSHTFLNLAGSGITYAELPAGQYYIAIKRLSDNAEIMPPLPFTIPAPSNDNDNTNPGPNNNQNPTGSTYSGLIPCGAAGQPPCDFDMLIVLINRVVDFLLFVIAFPVVAVVVAWAGVKLLISGGSSGAKEQAKSMMGHVVVGLIVALLAWGIIKLILTTLGYQGPLLSIFGIN
jgi:hypothetical protein